jgi:ABC-type transport system substrate-binding protein
MTNGAAAGGAAAAAAIAQAIKASGAIVSVESMDFMTILDKTDRPLVVCSESKFFSTKYHYLTAYKGLIFYTKSLSPLMLRPSVETIRAKKIWIPG